MQYDYDRHRESQKCFQIILQKVRKYAARNCKK